MDCPCEICLVRSICGSRLIQKSKHTNFGYLILEYAEECPLILDYFGINSAGRIDHDFDKIYKLCKVFGAQDETYFLWRANEIGIY
jgi:hypothetical protein